MGVIVPSYELLRDAFIVGEEPWALRVYCGRTGAGTPSCSHIARDPCVHQCKAMKPEGSYRGLAKLRLIIRLGY